MTDTTASSSPPPAAVDVAGRRWRTALVDSVMALRDAAREYSAALRLAQSGTWSVDLLRVNGSKATVRIGQHTSSRPHDKALYRIGGVFTAAATQLERLHEAAALAYAAGATWATRQVLDGASPFSVEFTGRSDAGDLEHPDPVTIPIATADGQDVAQWVKAPKLAAAREALAACLQAGEYGEDLAGRDYVTDHEAGEMHAAWAAARGTAEAAYAYGRLAEGALLFALNVVRRTG